MYDPKNAREMAGSGLPKDSIIDGEVTGIRDGLVRDFVAVSAQAKWKNLDSKAIEVLISTQDDIKIRQIFGYKVEDGKTVYITDSNLDLFRRKYGGLPAIGQCVKVTTDAKGFGKIKLE